MELVWDRIGEESSTETEFVDNGQRREVSWKIIEKDRQIDVAELQRCDHTCPCSAERECEPSSQTKKVRPANVDESMYSWD